MAVPTQILGYDVNRRCVLQIDLTAEGPILKRPTTAGTMTNLARLILPDGSEVGKLPDRDVVLDLLPRGDQGSHFNQVVITTVPGMPRFIRDLEFQARVRCYLGVSNDTLKVTGSLERAGTSLRWKRLAFYSWNANTSGFEIDKSFLGQNPLFIERTNIIPFWDLIGLRPSALIPTPISVELVLAPRWAPRDITGENLAEQLTAFPDINKDGPLVIRLSQKAGLSIQNQSISVGSFHVEIDWLTVIRAGLDRADAKWGVQHFQTQDVLDEDGGIAPEIGRSIWRFEGVPIIPALKSFNDCATRYLASLQTVQDGRPISGVPRIDDRVWNRLEVLEFPPEGLIGIKCRSEREFARLWNISLDIVDRRTENEPIPRVPSADRFAVHFRAAFPFGDSRSQDDVPVKYRCEFPGLMRHDAYYHSQRAQVHQSQGILAIDCGIEPLEALKDPGPGDTNHKNAYRSLKDSMWRGFVFRLRRWFRKDNPVLMPQTVRVGALDLVFPPPLELPVEQLFDFGDPDHPHYPSEAELNNLVNRGKRDMESLEQRQWSVISLGWRPGRGDWSGEVPTAAVEILFKIQQALPGGQDGLPDEPFNPIDVEDDVVESPSNTSRSAVRQRFIREAAVVIPADDTLPENEPFPLLLRLRERTARNQSQVLALNLFEWGSREQSLAAKDSQRLVVVDRQPMTVALVIAPPLQGIGGADGNLEIGNWSAAGFEGASWELAGASDGYRLDFPPQAVGETMEKRSSEIAPPPGSESDPRKGFDILEGKPAQFRLSPTSSFELESSYFRQNFTEAVWNLRRILGYPGQRAPGAGIRSLAFELLYGLGCEVRGEDLRLAELSSRLGAVPKSLPQNISRVLGKNRFGVDLDNQCALQAVFDYLNYTWSRQFAAYLSRLGVFEAWRQFNVANLNLTSGVQYELRDPSRITQDPTNPEEHNPGATQPRNLAGGALWGFDFVSQYRPFRDSSRTRRSTSGELSRPAFSALGGWGHQKAVFQNGLTTIYSDTSMGRCYFYSVERRGRIGCFWNHAKHVVIYERTVGTALQFRPTRDAAGRIVRPNQDHLAGRAVVRKVREFIEILQPRRSFPDLGGGDVARGCVQSVAFSQTIIPIDYRWGRDVFDAEGNAVGYVIPLWRPDADPVIYPKPQVSLRMAGAEEGQSLGCEVEDPQKFVFYSQADNQTGEEVNTDLWVAVRTVDFPDANWPAAAPPSAPTNGDLEQSLPDEVPVAPGYDEFTYHVLTAKPIDVVANRAKISTAALLRNVSMVRADPLSQDSASQNDDIKAALASQEKSHTAREALKKFRSLLDARLADSGVQAELKRLAQQVYDEFKGRGADTLQTQLRKILPNQNLTSRDWEKLTRTALSRWSKSAKGIIDKELKERLGDQLLQVREQAIENIKTQAKQWLTNSWDVFRLGANVPDPGATELAHQLSQAIDRLTAVPQSMRAVLDAILATVEQILNYPLPDIAPSAADCAALSAAAQDLQARMVNVVREAVEKAGEGLGKEFQSAVLFHARTLIKEVDEELTRRRRQLLGNMNRPADEILEEFYALYDWLEVMAKRVGAPGLPATFQLFRCSTNVAAVIQGLDNQTVHAALANDFKQDRLFLAAPIVVVNQQSLTWTITDRNLVYKLAYDGTDIGVFGSPLSRLGKALAEIEAALGILRDLDVRDAAGQVLDKLGKLVSSNELLDECLHAIEDVNCNTFAKVKAKIDALVGKLATSADRLTDLASAVPNLNQFWDQFNSVNLKDKLTGTIGDLQNHMDSLVNGFDAAAVQQLIDGAINDVDKMRRELEGMLGSTQAQAEGFLLGLAQPLAKKFPAGMVQKAGGLLRMVRAFGDAPLVQGMEFSRKRLGYFYDPLKSIKGLPIDMTPAVALVNRVGDHLKAMGVNLPTSQLLEQVLPPTDELLKQLDFGKLLPDFAGLKLDKLLPELKSPEGLKDKVKITQSFDKQAGRGWVQADVRVPVDGPSTLFDAGVLKVSLRDVLLTAQMRIEAGVSGSPTHRQFGKLDATWDLTLGGKPLITFEETQLSFDESGKTKFTLDPAKIRMNGVLQVLSDVVSGISTGGNGFVLRLKEENGMPVGVEARLDLPLPDLAFGAVAMTNLRLGAAFELVALPEFAIALAVNVCEKKTPFALTILCLGGGGWFSARGRYLPISNRLTTAVSIGLSAGAMLAVAFGPAKGAVFAFFYVEAELQTDSDNPGNRQLIIRIGLLLGGDLDVCGLISVSIRLLLEMEYDGSVLTGRGMLSIRVKVCFFLTISFSVAVEKRLAGSGQSNTSTAERQRRVQAAANKHLDRSAA